MLGSRFLKGLSQGSLSIEFIHLNFLAKERGEGQSFLVLFLNKQLKNQYPNRNLQVGKTLAPLTWTLPPGVPIQLICKGLFNMYLVNSDL